MSNRIDLIESIQLFSVWSEFRLWLDGTKASLEYKATEDSVDYYRIVTEPIGSVCLEIHLLRDGGADVLDFEANFLNATPRKTGTHVRAGSILYSNDNVEMAVQNSITIPANTRGLLIAGTDGAEAQFLNTDTSGRLVAVGAGTAGAPIGGILTVQGTQDGQPVIVQFGQTGGGTALPKMVNIVYDKTDGAILANTYKRVQTYTIPIGHDGYLIKFVSFQSEVAVSRCVAETKFGDLNIGTNVYTNNTQYTAPQFGGIIQAEVITTLSSGGGNIVVTVTYTNEVGTAGRSGTFTIPKGSVVGSRFDFVLQGTDLGISSIQNASTSPTLAAGALNILGQIHLAVHQDQNTSTQTSTLFAPGAITFPTGTIIGVEYKGGTVNKARFFDTLLQLIEL